MADISIINKDNTDYNVKDAAGRLALAEVENKGAKNLAPNTAKSETVSTVSFTVNSDGTVLANGTASTAAWFMTAESLTLQPGTYVISGGQEASGTVNVRVVFSTSKTAADIIADSNGESTEFTITSATTANVYVRMSTGRTANNVTVCPMICTKAEWDISHTYVPYGKTNAELTAENTIQQAEINYVVNAGAKNALPITNTTSEVSGITFNVNADNTVTSSGTLSSGVSNAVFEYSNFQLPAGKYIYSCEGAAQQLIRDSYVQKYNGSSWDAVARDYENNTFTLTQTEQIRVRLRVYSSGTSGTFKPMIRLAAITDPTYEPYAPTNRELYEEKIEIEDVFGSGTQILTNGTADITEIGNFYCSNADTAATIINAPWTDSGFFGFVRRSVLPSERFIQIAFKNNDTMAIAKRRYTGTWQPWAYSSSEPRPVGNYIMSYADSLPTPGVYFAYHIAGSGIDKPVSGHRYMYQIMMMSSSYGCIHAYELDPSSGAVMYIANKINGTWSPWYKIEGAPLT